VGVVVIVEIEVETVGLSKQSSCMCFNVDFLKQKS